MITFIYSVNKYLLSIGAVSIDKTDKILAPMELMFWWWDIGDIYI